MPPAGGGRPEGARPEDRPRHAGADVSAADELLASGWNALMEEALDDLALLNAGRITGMRMAG